MNNKLGWWSLSMRFELWFDEVGWSIGISPFEWYMPRITDNPQANAVNLIIGCIVISKQDLRRKQEPHR